MAPDDDVLSTQELKAIQDERTQAERDAAAEAPAEAQERTHGRRADKASYLAEKLEEQAESLDK